MEGYHKDILKIEIESLERMYSKLSSTYSNLLSPIENGENKKPRESKNTEITESIENKVKLSYLPTIIGIEKEIMLKTLLLYGIKESDIKIDMPPVGKEWDEPIGVVFPYESLEIHIFNHKTDNKDYKVDLWGCMFRKSLNKEQKRNLSYISGYDITCLDKFFSKNKEWLNLGYKEFYNKEFYNRSLRIFFRFYEGMVNEPFRESLFESIKPFLKDHAGEMIQNCYNYRTFMINKSPSKTIEEAIKIAELSLEEVRKIQNTETMFVRVKNNQTLEGKLRKADHI